MKSHGSVSATQGIVIEFDRHECLIGAGNSQFRPNSEAGWKPNLGY